MSLVVIVLSLGLVVSSLVRLALYNDAFGLTMLRLSSMIFAGWIGIVLILAGVDLIGAGLRGWLPVAVAASGLAVAALACRPDPHRSLWAANWSRWDAARHRDQLGCAPEA